MKAEQKLDKIMQSGLEVKFFNKPVRFVCDDGTRLWDMKIFWQHVDAETSEGFDKAIDCIDDCLKYIENYDK